jgi:hypothetical protein
MKSEFVKYLATLAITEDQPLFMKVEKLLKLAKSFGKEEPETIFVSEYFGGDGNRVLQSLWIFTPHYALEGKGFTGAEDTLDFCSLGGIPYVEISGSHSDFETPATDESRLRLTVIFAVSGMMSSNTGIFRASKKNCESLLAIYLKYIKPNIAG